MIPEDYYKSNIESNNLALLTVRKKIAWVSILRLIILVFAIYLLIKGIGTGATVFYIASFTTIIVFVVLVIFHRNLNRLSKISKILITLNQNELLALKGDFSNFEGGEEFLNIRHEFTYDLDIFGEKSVFQYINRCCTLWGKEKLAEKFIRSPYTAEEILNSQEIYAELSEYPDFMQQFLSHGLLKKDNPQDRISLFSWMNDKSYSEKNSAKIFRITMPLINILIIGAGIFHPSVFNFLYISVPIVWAFYGFNFKKINEYHSIISNKHDIIKKHTEFCQILAGKEFRNMNLQSMSEKCAQSLAGLKKFDRLMNYLDTRLNLIVGTILNTLFLFDFQIINRLERWKNNHPDKIQNLLEVPAEIDAGISLGIFIFNHPHFSMPSLSESRLEIKALSHPLIHNNYRISNDFIAGPDDRVFIITGANMAGKSTFLRALGVNMILAGIGVPVCAEKMSFTPVKILTGMRTTDSLADSESYFFAELKRLKMITETLNNKQKLMILLDEILKGTNSIDKHKGSVALVQKLAAHDCLAFIATHDLSLAEQEKVFPEAIKNYCFESYIEDGELVFDYKLNSGIAKNMNAYFLMQKMGIVDTNTKN